MWRVGNLIRSHRHRISSRLLLARWNDSEVIAERSGSRLFSRRFRGLEDPDEEEREELDRKKLSSFTASDMDFYTQMADEIEEEDEGDEAARLDEEYRLKQEEIHLELDSRTGRPWTDPWDITEEQWMSTTTYDDLPDWSPEYVSRISQERVKIHPDGIPTLASLAKIQLPEPACPHPGLGQAKAYAAYKKRMHYRHITEKVKELAKPRVEKILNLHSWDDKQDAVDELFESLEEDLKSQDEILGKHPQFGKWVERALQEFLVGIKKGSNPLPVDNSDEGSAGSSKENTEAGNARVDDESSSSNDGDESAQPLFMDCYSSDDPEEQMVPTILSPLKVHKQDGPGRMIEEWELSAHKKTKRILLRQCTSAIATTLEENDSSRIYVHGRKGVGKSAVLASIVASARRSGHIVWYLPDGDRLRKNGYFITPNAQREGMFDLQNLSQEACSQFLLSHEDDLQGFEADKETMELYFKESQLQEMENYSGESIALVDLLKHAAEVKSNAPMCYSVVVDRLMNQEDKPFLMVLDDFNCYYDKGHYYHMAWDEDVRDPIPCERITLFEHALGVMGLSTSDDDDPKITKHIKRGGIVVGVTESHAVARRITDSLTASAKRQSTKDGAPTDLHIVEVPRFSDIEADHILANFEATGVGKLRMDRGETLMDEQEVAYLKMVSGCIGQNLLDSSIL